LDNKVFDIVDALYNNEVRNCSTCQPESPKPQMLRSEVLTEAADQSASNIRHDRANSALKLTDWDVLSHSFLRGAVIRLFS